MVAATIVILVAATTIMTRNSMIESATAQLSASIGNQGDNIESWLDENLEFFSTAKKTIEATNPTDSELQEMLDAWYGFNSNAPEGLYIATSDGKTYKATDSAKDLSDALSSEWYKQGMTRVSMAYGSAYKDDNGASVISASGIIDDGEDDIKIIYCGRGT